MKTDSVLHQSALIHAIYFDGGTPSTLSAHDSARIIATSRGKLPLAPDCEVTIEGRVLNFDAERINACFDAGANRFSIGIQSFNSKIRKKIARTSDDPTAIAFMESLVKRGRAVVICDLLFGLSGRGAQTWGEDLVIARDIDFDGVDLYVLNILPSTPLDKTVENRRTVVPSPAEHRDLHLQGCDFMDDAGWRCISSSHWGRITRERNLYSLLIKRGADRLVFGSEAGDSISGCSWMNEHNLRTWHESVAAGEKPLMMIMRNAERNAQWRHTLQPDIETACVPLDELTSHTGKLALLLVQWHQKGLSHDASVCLRLTNEGRFWASNILQFLNELIQVLNALAIALEKP